MYDFTEIRPEKVDMLDLYPFSFREFLLAMDEKSLVMALDSKDFSIIDNFSDKFLFWLKNYYYIGGMPAVVDSFRRNKDYVKTRQIQKDILRQYEQDFMIQTEDRIVPIEVKAEGNVYSQSLKAYCEKYHPKKAVRFSTLKYVDQGWMVNIPLYAISTL